MFPLFEKYSIYPKQENCITSFNTIYMKDTYCKRTYKCKCGIAEEFVWESELKTFKFTCKCGNKLGYQDLKKVEVPQMASIRTPTKNR